MVRRPCKGRAPGNAVAMLEGLPVGCLFFSEGIQGLLFLAGHHDSDGFRRARLFQEGRQAPAGQRQHPLLVGAGLFGNRPARGSPKGIGRGKATPSESAGEAGREDFREAAGSRSAGPAPLRHVGGHPAYWLSAGVGEKLRSIAALPTPSIFPSSRSLSAIPETSVPEGWSCITVSVLSVVPGLGSVATDKK